MLPRERVIAVIEGRRPDRIPVYGWLRQNLEDTISQAFGSVEAFEDRYEFDLSHIFGGPKPFSDKIIGPLRARHGGEITPMALMEIGLPDPDDESRYADVKEAVAHHKTQRGRFVYVQTPGIFEIHNWPFRMEDHLAYMAMYESELREVYERQSQWSRAFAMNCLDLGVDMIHVSDDWGAQHGLMFSPRMWRDLIFPYHRIICDAVKGRGAYLSLHSDGNISQVLGGVAELGYNVVHPYQESAGMDFEAFRRQYSGSFAIMGGLDVQTTLGFGDFERLEREIRRILGMFREGGLIFCTSHFVQNHCSMRELTFAYDLVYRLLRELANA